MSDLEHLKHMVAVRPDGPDKLAAAWAIGEIKRLRAVLREIIELKPEDMYHAVERSMAAAIARSALEEK